MKCCWEGKRRWGIWKGQYVQETTPQPKEFVRKIRLTLWMFHQRKSQQLLWDVLIFLLDSISLYLLLLISISACLFTHLLLDLISLLLEKSVSLQAPTSEFLEVFLLLLNAPHTASIGNKVPRVARSYN